MGNAQKLTVTPQKQAQVLKNALTSSRVRVTSGNTSIRRAPAAKAKRAS